MARVYRVKRFSQDLIDEGEEYISNKVDSGLDTIHTVSSKLEGTLNLDKEKRPAKLIRLAKDLSYLLKKKKKHKGDKQK